MTDPDQPAHAGYDELASRTDEDDPWRTPWGDNPLQRYYSWPATRELLPSLDGRRILDAGCGVGDHVEELLDGGASVVGVDASADAVATARDRFEVEDRATFEHVDLRDPLPFDDDSFDAVVSHLVLDHLERLEPTLGEFRRVLADGGVLAFTVVHPLQFYCSFDEVEAYYDRTAVELGWDAPVTSYHRPMGDIVEATTAAGFAIDRFAEPRPPAEYVEYAAEEWAVEERPQILCVRATA